MRETLLRPILAGRIEYDGELISRVPGEPIIAERDWLRLRAMIEARRRGRPHVAAVPGVGGAAVRGVWEEAGRADRDRHAVGGRAARWRYVCNAQRGGCGVSIEMAGTDGELRSLTIARLSDSRYAAAIATARAQVSAAVGGDHC